MLLSPSSFLKQEGIFLWSSPGESGGIPGHKTHKSTHPPPPQDEISLGFFNSQACTHSASSNLSKLSFRCFYQLLTPAASASSNMILAVILFAYCSSFVKAG